MQYDTLTQGTYKDDQASASVLSSATTAVSKAIGPLSPLWGTVTTCGGTYKHALFAKVSVFPSPSSPRKYLAVPLSPHFPSHKLSGL